MAKSAVERLAAIRLKIERAKKHVEEFNRSTTTFVDRKPYRLWENIDPDTGDKVYRLRITAETPGDWPVIIGDIASNLRAALDYLAWQLVEANNQTPGRHTSFPICEGRTKYETVADGAKIKGAGDDAIRILDAVKPYKGGNDGLWALNAVASHDKHRFLLGVPMALCGMRVHKQPGISRFVTHLVGNRIPAEDGMELGRLKFPFSDADKVDFEFSFTVTFVEPEVIKGEPVVPFLSQFCSLTNEVIDKFAPLL